MEKIEKNDDRQRNSEQPEQSTAHDLFLLLCNRMAIAGQTPERADRPKALAHLVGDALPSLRLGAVGCSSWSVRLFFSSDDGCEHAVQVQVVDPMHRVERAGDREPA
jgi:hypothetical protein